MFTRKIIIIIGIVLTLIAFWIFRVELMGMMRWFADLDVVTADMQRIGIWGPIILFALFVFQVFFAFIPGQALMVACGYLYGFWGGFLLSWLSLVAGGELAFVLARKYGRPFAEQWVSATTLSKWDKAAEGQSIAFFAFSLVLPLLPNDAMCYVAGLGNISSRRFTLANSLGRGLACLFTSAAGAFGSQLSLHVWGIIAIVIVMFCLGWVIVKNFKPHFLMA